MDRNRIHRLGRVDWVTIIFYSQWVGSGPLSKLYFDVVYSGANKWTIIILAVTNHIQSYSVFAQIDTLGRVWSRNFDLVHQLPTTQTQLRCVAQISTKLCSCRCCAVLRHPHSMNCGLRTVLSCDRGRHQLVIVYLSVHGKRWFLTFWSTLIFIQLQWNTSTYPHISINSRLVDCYMNQFDS